MRREEITNKKIKKLFLKREEEKNKLQEIMDTANVVGKEINEMKKKYDDLLKPVKKQKYKVQRIDEKLYPLIEAEKIVLDEFEETRQPIIEDKKVYLEIANLVDEFKKHVREQRNDKSSDSNSK